ncbi:MAG TPA: hypothetical protein VGA98_10275 [Allosphingosinicella sp.]|jgi:hypothetical protein
MPETITLGHVLTALAALAALYGLVQFAVSMRYTGPGHGRGTPGYARARDAKRYTIWGAAAVLLFFALAWLTPLGRIPLS